MPNTLLNLSDRDRELLDLSYRHGLDVGELAMVLGVPRSVVNTRFVRLRQTVRRRLGPLLAGIVKDWDERTGRHVDVCPTCARAKRQRVNPRTLPGDAPAFLPAPEWLRSRTLNAVRKKVCDGSAPDAPTHEGSPSGVVPLRRRFP